MIIEFSIEAWRAGGKPVTRDGREVKQLHQFEAEDEQWPFVGVLSNNLRSWDPDGHFMSELNPREADLQLEIPDDWVVDGEVILPDPPKEYYVTLHKTSLDFLATSIAVTDLSVAKSIYNQIEKETQRAPIGLFKLVKVEV